MKILHVAAIGTEKYFGVNIAVPHMINAQETYAEVTLLNTLSIKVDSVKNQLELKEIKPNKDFFSSYDLVVFHEAYVKEYLLFAGKLVRWGIPYVIVAHGELTMQAQKQKWLKKKIANLLLFSYYFEHAVAVHCLSEMECNMTQIGKNEFISSNGVLPAKRTKTSFSTEEIRFIYVGRLDVKVKGIDLMLRAIQMTQRELSEAHAVIDLYGPDIEGQSRLVKKMIEEYGLEQLVTLHKEILDEEKTDRLLHADVFLQTSRTEGMPLGVLEALSIGLPCLITKGTNLAETVQNANAGWGVKTNAEAIAEGIRTVIKEKERLAEKSEHAVRLTEETFTWDKIAKKTIQRYGELIGQNEEGQ